MRVTSLLEYRLRKTGATMRTQVAPDLPPLAAMPHGLEQILINLIGNALDAVAGAPGPLIQVRAQRVGHDPRFAEIEVADNGSGVAKTARAKLFETLLHDQGRGTGDGPRDWRSAARSRAAWAAISTLLEQPGEWPEPAVTVFRLTVPVSQEL